MNRILIAIVFSLAFIGLARAEPELGTSDYQEHAVDNYLVRISKGPGEPQSIGSYAIHIYEALGFPLKAGVIRPRDGSLAKSWVTAADKNHPTRIWIWTQVTGSGAYGTLELFEFAGGSIRAVRMPAGDTDDPLFKGYRGHDLFDVQKGQAYRQFPVYAQRDVNADSRGGTSCLELNIMKSKWQPSKHCVEPVTP